ncbi:MAG: tetratricopeptide repeat protein, partial [candidate division WOR-3 bacterium]
VVSAVLDFETPSYRNAETALFALRQALRESHHVRFPSFDIVYGLYWRKTRPQTPLPEKGIPLLEESEAIAEIIEVAAEVPLLRIVPVMAGLIARGSRLLKEWWLKRGEQELRSLPGFEPEQIAERLPMFWAADLNDHLSRRPSPAVLFLDSYEALLGDERSDARFLNQDAWVRELVAHLPGILWVICGREKLRWAELDPDWEACLEQHLVGGLAETDARTFLSACGIVEPRLQQAIIKGSAGVPYYLDLAVDTYEAIRTQQQREPVPEDFARTPRELLARFLRHLNQAETETLKALAPLRFWDQELFSALVSRFQTGYPLTAFANLCRFSFVSEASDHRNWRMHQLMRSGLRQHLGPALSCQIHKFAFDYYAAQLTRIEPQDIDASSEQALLEAWYHGQHTGSVSELAAWLHQAARPFMRAARWRFLTPFYVELLRLIVCKTPDSSSGQYEEARVRAELATLQRWQAQFSAAEKNYLRAIELFEQTLGPEHPELAAVKQELGTQYWWQGKYRAAETTFWAALRIREQSLGEMHPETAATLVSLADLLREQGKDTEAEPLMVRALKIRREVLPPDDPALAASLQGLAALRAEQTLFHEAEELNRQALTVWQRVLGSNHPYCGIALNSLGILYNRQARYKEAESVLRQALGLWEGTAPDHPNVGIVLDNLGQSLLGQGRLELA